MNTEFTGSLESDQYKFQHYYISDISSFVNGKHLPNDGLTLVMDHEKMSIMGYRTLFEASGTHHSNTALQRTHDIYLNDNFMLLSVLTNDRGASVGSYVTPR